MNENKCELIVFIISWTLLKSILLPPSATKPTRPITQQETDKEQQILVEATTAKLFSNQALQKIHDAAFMINRGEELEEKVGKEDVEKLKKALADLEAGNF